MDTATGIIRLIQGVIPGAMAATNTFDKVGSCLSMQKTHHKNERLLTQLPQHSQPQEKPEGGGHKKSDDKKFKKVVLFNICRLVEVYRVCTNLLHEPRLVFPVPF